MKKIVLALLFSSLLLTSCDSEEAEEIYEDEVYEIIEEDPSYGETEGVEYRYEYDRDGNQFAYKIEKEYDSKGQVVLELWVAEDGSIHKKCELDYDDDGNETLRAYYDDTDTVYRKFEYTYDKKGNQKTVRETNYNDSGFCFVTEKDENGNETLDATYDAEGNELYKEETKYNSFGKATFYEKYENGTLVQKSSYEYDLNGNLLLKIDFDSEGNETYKEIHKYDVNGDKTAEEQYRNGKIDMSYAFDANKTTVTRYDKNEEVKSVEVRERGDKERFNTFYDKDGNMTARYVYRYDEKGNNIYESYENTKKPQQNYEREHVYDSDGNHVETIDLLKQ